MIILNGSGDILQAVMGTAATTTNPNYYVSYADVNLNNLVQANKSNGALNGTSAVAMLTGNSDQLKVDQIDIYNTFFQFLC
jgi:hypothetical protein